MQTMFVFSAFDMGAPRSLEKEGNTKTASHIWWFESSTNPLREFQIPPNSV